MNKNYLSGRRFEYDLMTEWREKGYSLIRSAGSHGSYDLIAFTPDRPVELIQAKVVASETTMKRMFKAFKRDIPSSRFYHQVMAVKIKGSSKVYTCTV